MARTQRRLGFADAGGTGADDRRDTPGTVTINGGLHGGGDLFQRAVQQGIVATLQRGGQRGQVRQHGLHATQRQRATGQHVIAVAQATGVVGEQAGGNLRASAAKRADDAHVVEENRHGHGASSAADTERMVSE